LYDVVVHLAKILVLSRTEFEIQDLGASG
jgi:hypothetical protein